ncbi:MAG: tetratricopeptide repeat protein [Steroidobacteraceae bacterium]
METRARRWARCAWLAVLVVASTSAQVSDPQASLRQIAQQALQAHDERRYDEALGLYQQLLQVDAKDTWVLYEMAQIHGAQDNFAECIKYAQRALKTKGGEQPATFRLLGACQDDGGKGKDAARTLAKAVKKFPKDGMVNYSYAVTLLRQNQVNKALKPLQVAIDETPEFADPYITYAGLLKALSSRAGQALMGLRFLMIEPDTERAVALVQAIDKSLSEGSAGFEAEESKPAVHISLGSLLHRDLAGFDMIFPGVAAKAKLVAQEKNLNASDRFVWTLATLLTVMARDDDRPTAQGFIWTHSFNSLNTLSERGVLDTYLYHVAAIGKLDGAEAWLRAHQQDVLGLAKVMDEFPGGRLE